MQRSLIYIVNALSQLYIAMFLLRFILQWVRGSYQSPLSQVVMKVTGPLVIPARRVLPSVRGIDVPTLVLLIALEAISTLLLYLIARYPLVIDLFVGSVLLRLVALTLWVYWGALLIYVILSWVVQGYHPLAATLGTLLEPLLRPVRKVLPPVAGFDLSPMLVMIVLYALILALPSFPFVP
jgi:YggT family protein